MIDDPTVTVSLSQLRRILDYADAAYAVAERVARSASDIDGVDDADVAILRLGVLMVKNEAARLIRDEDDRRSAMFLPLAS